jgi:hypothetical protein
MAQYIDSLKTPEIHTSDTQHPPSVRKIEYYSDIVAGRGNNKKFKIIRSKWNHTTETTKELIKTKINPTEIKVRISTFKAPRDGRTLIEVGSKDETEGIRTAFLKSAEKCLKPMYRNSETQD